MFEPWKVEKTLTVEEMYGAAKPPIPAGFRGIAFRPAKNGEKWLGFYGHRVITAYGDYPEDTPVIILAPALTEIEERYGEGATVESVWAKYCPDPSKYGKPRFDYPPDRVGWVAMGGEFFTPNSRVPGTRRVYAHLLNDWQILYGEAITDAAALEAKLQAEGKLEENQFIEAKMRWVNKNDTYVATSGNVYTSYATISSIGDSRAIVGTRKQRFLKVPLRDDNHIELGACGQYSRDTFQRGRIYIVHECAVLGAQIIEE